MNELLTLTAADFEQLPGWTARGAFYLTGCVYTRLSGGEIRARLRLADGSGELLGMFDSNVEVVRRLVLDAPVIVTGEVYAWRQATPLMRVHSLRPAGPDDITCAAAMLPLSNCPPDAVPALHRLIELERALPAPLSGFLRRVLLDPRIGLPFLRCRASVSHHHHMLGGLLIHSTDGLDEIALIVRTMNPDDPFAPALAQLGYLLHDIGKLRTVGDLRRPLNWRVLAHETHNFLMLAPHLDWLEAQSPDLAAGLKYTFEYIATPADRRGYARFLPAEVVIQFDRWSAASHNNRTLRGLLGREPRWQTPAANDCGESFLDTAE